jgi:hypothetical protein
MRAARLLRIPVHRCASWWDGGMAARIRWRRGGIFAVTARGECASVKGELPCRASEGRRRQGEGAGFFGVAAGCRILVAAGFFCGGPESGGSSPGGEDDRDRGWGERQYAGEDDGHVDERKACILYPVQWEGGHSASEMAGRRAAGGICASAMKRTIGPAKPSYRSSVLKLEHFQKHASRSSIRKLTRGLTLSVWDRTRRNVTRAARPWRLAENRTSEKRELELGGAVHDTLMKEKLVGPGLDPKVWPKVWMDIVGGM